MLDFMSRLKAATTGSPDTPLLVLGNFEVEQVWAQGETGLPRMSFSPSGALVNRMDEFGLLLAGPGDHLVVKAPPDEGYLGYLAGLGLGLPEVLDCAHNDPQRTVSADTLRDPGLLDRISALARRGVYLLPHGVSTVEEEIAARCGMRLAAAPAVTCKRVNSKVYSRLLATRHELRQPPGRACQTLAEWDDAVEWARKLLALGHTVVVKDAFGVSGKGMVQVTGERRLDHLHRKVMAGGAAGGGIALVVEEWVEKSRDLNYQFTIGRDGAVRFDFVKELLTDSGVHRGHRMPARLTGDQIRLLEKTATLLGDQLGADGFFGVVGVDAMVDPNGLIYPVIEINARHNMSTYQARLQEELIEPGQVVLARHYPFRTRVRITFETFGGALGTLLYRPGRSGLLVNNFATANVTAAPEDPVDGRIYGLVVADDEAGLDALDAEIATRIAGLEETS